jgi:hypothetical protein
MVKRDFQKMVGEAFPGIEVVCLSLHIGSKFKSIYLQYFKSHILR